MENLLTFLVPISTAVATVVTLTWWLSRQFDNMKSRFDKKLEEVKIYFSDKLEYHEKHDDIRFSDLKNDIWMIRLRAAAKEGVLEVTDHGETQKVYSSDHRASSKKTPS